MTRAQVLMLTELRDASSDVADLAATDAVTMKIGRLALAINELAREALRDEPAEAELVHEAFDTTDTPTPVNDNDDQDADAVPAPKTFHEL